MRKYRYLFNVNNFIVAQINLFHIFDSRKEIIRKRFQTVVIEIKLDCVVRQIWRIELLIFQLNTVNFYAVLKYKNWFGNVLKRKLKDLFVQKTVTLSLVAEAASRTVSIILEDRAHPRTQTEEGCETHQPHRKSHCDDMVSCDDNIIKFVLYWSSLETRKIVTVRLLFILDLYKCSVWYYFKGHICVFFCKFSGVFII